MNLYFITTITLCKGTKSKGNIPLTLLVKILLPYGSQKYD